MRGSLCKKSPSLIIEKNIARILKHINVFEYKSPHDYISLHSFHKTLAYTFLYASLNKVVLKDMTVSIIGSRYPGKLFKELKGEGYGRVVVRERGRVGAYLYTVVESNSGALREVVEMGKKKLTLREVLEESGLTAEWEERGKIQGEALGKVQGERTAWGKAINLLKQGYTVEQLEQMDPVDSPLPTNP
ncbi:MAG: hypothetical protein LBL56_05640 [Treponema sp.]|jgi:hypothetical protein|nr:hypothetical protein [Treponema sp.]